MSLEIPKDKKDSVNDSILDISFQTSVLRKTYWF